MPVNLASFAKQRVHISKERTWRLHVCFCCLHSVSFAYRLREEDHAAPAQVGQMVHEAARRPFDPAFARAHVNRHPHPQALRKYHKPKEALKDGVSNDSKEEHHHDVAIFSLLLFSPETPVVRCRRLGLSSGSRCPLQFWTAFPFPLGPRSPTPTKRLRP